MSRYGMTAGAACLVALIGAGCTTAVPYGYPADPYAGTTPLPAPIAPPKVDAATAARNFTSVVYKVEPVAEQVCVNRTGGGNCNLQIVIDDRPGQPVNAFQTLDANGRPVIAFTQALLADARNPDELAFILGHEAAHHILGHIPRQQTTAALGGAAGGLLASVLGAGEGGVQVARDLGATVGARGYSKEYELEADALGTTIAFRAGYDPERGAAFFARIPDPGDRFLGSHPPNDQRIATVRQTLATLK